ncbi:MAG TPA: DUF2950 domain-containing protein [Tepidisphaeraceae bacterium]|jgi:hypothetical protein
MFACFPSKWLVSVAGLALLALGCASAEPPKPQTPPPPTPPQQQKFASPQSAVGSLVSALRAGDQAQLGQIFGPDDSEIISSGDPVADRSEISRFLAAYDAQHRLQREPDGRYTLIVGTADWPFPVPILKSGDQYVFDSDAGKDEILNRRIGRNELSTELVCLAIVDAQRDYVALRPMGGDLPAYAQKIVSDPGTKNGLYWPTKEGEKPSPLGVLAALAAAEGYGTTRPAGNRPPPYHGYRYRLLTAQGPHAEGGAADYRVDGQLIGGFGVVAYPAQYGNSGITTFITNHDGIVYQRDLGPDTERIAESMTQFDPDPGWTKATDASRATYGN